MREARPLDSCLPRKKERNIRVDINVYSTNTTVPSVAVASLKKNPGMYMLVTIYNLSSGIWHLTLATAYVLGNKRTPLKES